MNRSNRISRVGRSAIPAVVQGRQQAVAAERGTTLWTSLINLCSIGKLDLIKLNFNTMATSTSLAADIRVQLENVRQVLGLSQGELAGLAGISQGNVSNCLQGKPVKIDSLRRLLSAFASQVAAAADKGLSNEQIRELRKAVDSARKAVDGSVEVTSYFARPGGPMPENATNRIRRPEDRKLLAALDDAPFTAAIIGPPECGKTTTLQLLVEEARRRGFAVVDFDAQILEDVTLEGRREDREALLTARFLPEFAAEVGRVIGEKPPELMSTSLDLVRFLRESRFRRPAPPLLIAVDHTTAIPLAVETLVQVCRTLEAQKGRTQMSWVIEAGNLADSHRHGSLSRLAPSPIIEMGWLSEAQVKELADIYEIQTQRIVDFLWDAFLGQPALTHTAMASFRDHSAFKVSTTPDLLQDVREEMQYAQGGFGQQIRRLRDHLNSARFWKEFKPIPPDANSFLAECERDRSKRVIAERFGLLSTATSPGLKPQMPGFYKDHYEDLLHAS